MFSVNPLFKSARVGLCCLRSEFSSTDGVMRLAQCPEHKQALNTC